MQIPGAVKEFPGIPGCWGSRHDCNWDEQCRGPLALSSARQCRHGAVASVGCSVDLATVWLRAGSKPRKVLKGRCGFVPPFCQCCAGRRMGFRSLEKEFAKLGLGFPEWDFGKTQGFAAQRIRALSRGQDLPNSPNQGGNQGQPPRHFGDP